VIVFGLSPPTNPTGCTSIVSCGRRAPARDGLLVPSPRSVARVHALPSCVEFDLRDSW
jgi:hypothetical protein